LKTALVGFGVSALWHVAVWLAVMPLLVWQDKLALPETQPTVVPLSLAQFQPTPPVLPVVPVAPAPVVNAEPRPKPEPKPKPTPTSKPTPKPTVEKKPVVKKLPATKPKPKPEPKPTHAPSPPKPAARAMNPVMARPQSPAPVRAAPVMQAPVAPQATPQPAPAPVAPAPTVDNAAAEAAYRQKLQNLIGARKQYPRQAERAEVEGTVTLAFTALPNGTLTNVRVSQSSGNEWLDKAALQAVNGTSGALPFPASIRRASWPLTLKVNFRLE